MKLPANDTHPKGESIPALKTPNLLENKGLSVDTFSGKVHVEWNPQAAVTPLGQLSFFIEYLKLGNLFDPWVAECPLSSTSNNASSNRDLLGTLVLSVLSGYKRYAHITALRADTVNPGLLGMSKVVSEDAMRRAFIRMEESSGIQWLQTHLHNCYEPLLTEPWILDVDTTVKVLYGEQEGAVVGYNPTKPGRPSHTYHSYFIANLRLVLDVEVQAGNQSASSYSAPDLWALLERLPITSRPHFIRGDIAFGTEGIMSTAEAKKIRYLFKLKQTKNVIKLIEKRLSPTHWSSAGQGWEGQESTLQLSGWTSNRRVIVLRRKVKKEKVSALEQKQLSLNFKDIEKGDYKYTYAVLVTSLTDEISTIYQHYRDRADSENNFDELKNQWGWAGFTTQDLKRCRLISRIVALIYNWWNLFVRIAEPDKYREAITSRPLLLHAIGKQTTHAGQTYISISSLHGNVKKVKLMLNRIVHFFQLIKANAEQLTPKERWYQILSKAVEKYLKGRLLRPPVLLIPSG